MCRSLAVRKAGKDDTARNSQLLRKERVKRHFFFAETLMVVPVNFRHRPSVNPGERRPVSSSSCHLISPLHRIYSPGEVGPIVPGRNCDVQQFIPWELEGFLHGEFVILIGHVSS